MNKLYLFSTIVLLTIGCRHSSEQKQRVFLRDFPNEINRDSIQFEQPKIILEDLPESSFQKFHENKHVLLNKIPDK